MSQFCLCLAGIISHFPRFWIIFLAKAPLFVCQYSFPGCFQIGILHHLHNLLYLLLRLGNLLFLFQQRSEVTLSGSKTKVTSFSRILLRLPSVLICLLIEYLGGHFCFDKCHRIWLYFILLRKTLMYMSHELVSITKSLF